ncbi:MAG: hypothetical protein AAF411_03810 [Myxococcota bacterium]
MRHVVLCAVMLFLSPLASLAAQDASDDELARELFEAAEVSVGRGDYERALELFQESFELSDRPELLFNAGNAAERVRRDELAVELYTAYLERLPEASNRQAVEARLTRLRRLVEEEEEDNAAPVESNEPRRTNAWAWALGSSTVAFTALGIAARVRANRIFSDLEDECSNAPGCSDERLNGTSIERWDRTTVAAFTVAGASAIGLTVALILGRRGRSETATQVDISPTGLSVRGSF